MCASGPEALLVLAYVLVRSVCMFMGPNDSEFYPIALRPSLYNVYYDVFGVHSTDVLRDRGGNATLVWGRSGSRSWIYCLCQNGDRRW